MHTKATSSSHWVGTYLGRRLKNLFGHLGLGSDTDSVISSDLGQELLFRPRLDKVIDLVTLRLERVDGTGRDVLEQQDSDLFRSQRLENSRLA